LKANDLSIVISAPSGAGKTTLIRRLLDAEGGFSFSVSMTTRPRRDGEREGIHYYFVSAEEFRRCADRGDFVEWAVVHGNYYGTPKKEIDRIQSAGKIPIFDVDVQGARSLKNRLEGAVFIFIVPPSRQELESRLRNRKTDTEEHIQMRLRNALGELHEYRMFDYIVVNDDLDAALDRLRSIVTAEQCRRERVAPIIDVMVEE
jgi:guanylate kinase